MVCQVNIICLLDTPNDCKLHNNIINTDQSLKLMTAERRCRNLSAVLISIVIILCYFQFSIVVFAGHHV